VSFKLGVTIKSVMLSVIMLSVIMLSVDILSVIMLNVGVSYLLLERSNFKKLNKLGICLTRWQHMSREDFYHIM
jgi:hypothetical protein